MATSSDDEPDGNTSGSSSDASTETVISFYVCTRTYNMRSVCQFLGHRIYIAIHLETALCFYPPFMCLLAKFDTTYLALSVQGHPGGIITHYAPLLLCQK